MAGGDLDTGRADSGEEATSTGGSSLRVPTAIIDQAAAAGSNLLFMLVGARWLDADEFGVLGLLYAVYLLVLGAARALAAEPALVRADQPDWRKGTTGAGLAVALVGAALVALAALGGVQRGPALVLAVFLPALIVQDMGRYLGFAARRPARALRLDLVWAGSLVLALAGLAVTGTRSATSLLAAWGGSGAVSAVVFLAVHLQAVPVPSTRWIRSSWRFSWRYLVAFATTAGVTYAAIVALGAIDGVESVGTIRATQIIFGPLNIVYAGVLVTLVPDGHGLRWTSSVYQRRLRLISACLAVMAALVTIGSLALPDSFGEALLGDSWANARTILLPVGVTAVLASLLAGAEIGLRAGRAVQASLRTQLCMAPVYLFLPIAGAALHGIDGFAWATAASIGIGAVTWWLVLAACLRRADPAHDQHLAPAPLPAPAPPSGAQP